jgi:hypothetical protein
VYSLGYKFKVSKVSNSGFKGFGLRVWGNGFWAKGLGVGHLFSQPASHHRRERNSGGKTDW